MKQLDDSSLPSARVTAVLAVAVLAELAADQERGVVGLALVNFTA